MLPGRPWVGRPMLTNNPPRPRKATTSWQEVRSGASVRPWAAVTGNTSAPSRPRNAQSEGSGRLRTGWVAEIGGATVELVPVAELALALGRRPRTIRMWETLGVLPPAPFRTHSHDHRGRRRLYSQAHVSGIVEIARQEGLLSGTPADISKTGFSSRVHALYGELAQRRGAVSHGPAAFRY